MCCSPSSLVPPRPVHRDPHGAPARARTSTGMYRSVLLIRVSGSSFARVGLQTGELLCGSRAVAERGAAVKKTAMCDKVLYGLRRGPDPAIDADCTIFRFRLWPEVIMHSSVCDSMPPVYTLRSTTGGGVGGSGYCISTVLCRPAGDAHLLLLADGHAVRLCHARWTGPRLKPKKYTEYAIWL